MDEEREGEGGGGGLPANLDDCGWGGEGGKFLTAFCECHEGAPP